MVSFEAKWGLKEHQLLCEWRISNAFIYEGRGRQVRTGGSKQITEMNSASKKTTHLNRNNTTKYEELCTDTTTGS